MVSFYNFYKTILSQGKCLKIKVIYKIQWYLYNINKKYHGTQNKNKQTNMTLPRYYHCNYGKTMVYSQRMSIKHCKCSNYHSITMGHKITWLYHGTYGKKYGITMIYFQRMSIKTWQMSKYQGFTMVHIKRTQNGFTMAYVEKYYSIIMEYYQRK